MNVPTRARKLSKDDKKRMADIQRRMDKAAAEYDAQWFVDFWKKEGKKVPKPRVYRVRLEPV